MGLEDDLKARTSALISQQMANWVVEIQRAIQGHQAALVRALDELGETVARYDEKVDEVSISAAVSEVLAQQGPSADYSGLKASIAAIDRGTNLSEVLTALVTEATKHLPRVAMFILKNNAAVGWYARGFNHNDVVRSLSVPLTADTVFRIVHSSRHATRGHVTHSPGTAQALGRLGGDLQGILAVPLILRDKVAAVLFGTTSEEEVPTGASDALEILVSFAGKAIDVLSGAPKAAGASSTSPGVGTSPGFAAGGTGTGPRPAIAAPPPPQAAPDLGSSTVMFQQPSPAARSSRPATNPPVRSAPSPFLPPSAPAPPAPPPARGVPPDEQKAHDDAKRFARLVVSEIKLYNEAKVAEGRRTKDIYERLKEDIERGRQMYHDRVPANVRDATDYFHDELVRILAGGDASALGAL
jgi:hypothetical protein